MGLNISALKIQSFQYELKKRDQESAAAIEFS
ncbi:MAG: hypothetical protein ACI9TB_003005 [Parasphingorhabdus sp.]|jgi:hypothetical protein